MKFGLFYYYWDSILFIHSMKIITYETIYFLSKSGLVNASFNPVSMHSNTSNFELGIKFNLFTLTKHWLINVSKNSLESLLFEVLLR